MPLFSPKRKQNRNKSETIVDKAVGLVKKPSGPTPGQIATQNRDISAEIISVLRSIDFAHGRQDPGRGYENAPGEPHDF